MKTIFYCTLVCLLMSSFYDDDGWTPLLDKDLTMWEKYLSFRHTVDYTGEPPKDKDGLLLKPIGYNKDEENVFSIIVEQGEPVLKISGEIYGCLFTKREFENYHLRLKVKWGKAKHQPRTDKLKDTGILYHSIGESGVDYWRAWMLSQELQIMEGHMGDYWNIANSAIDIRALPAEGKMNRVANAKQPFLPFGSGASEGFCLRSENFESQGGDWTTIELICFQGKSLHIVSGHVVMILQNSRYVDNGKPTPLTKGKIQLQSEGAEVFYKDIQIKNISALPREFAVLF